MKLTLCVVGRMRAKQPETQLVADYLERMQGVGRGLGITQISIQEVEERRSLPGDQLKQREADLLRAVLPQGAWLVALDEHGENLSSRAFAARLGQWRNTGQENVAFLIGGADGLSSDLLDACNAKIAFGTMTWPHRLVRVMLIGFA